MDRMLWLWGLLAVVAGLAFRGEMLWGGEGTLPPAIVELPVAPKKTSFEGNSWRMPIVIKSSHDAAKYFQEDAIKTIASQVDIEKQVLLLFVWHGSGQDKLDYQVAESCPEQITFFHKAGLTRDLRLHTRVFALRANVKWKVHELR